MPNIVVLTIPLLSHINPCITLANLLIPHGFTFTFVITEEIAGSLPNLALNPEAGDLTQVDKPPIRYVSVPGTSSDVVAQLAPGMPRFAQLLETIRLMRSWFEDVLPSLLLGPDPVSCIISDCFAWWATEVGQRFEVPTFIFFTANAHSMSAFLHIDELIACGASPMSGNYISFYCHKSLLTNQLVMLDLDVLEVRKFS